MEHFNIVLFILGGFFVVISSIQPKNTSAHLENSETELELAND